MGAEFVDYIVIFTISRFVISRFECTTIMQVFITPGEHFSCLKTAVYSKTFYEWVFTREFDNFLNLTNYELNAFIQSVGIPEIPREYGFQQKQRIFVFGFLEIFCFLAKN